MLDGSTWAVCDKCSAVVANEGAHAAWHQGLIEALVRTARQVARQILLRRT